MTPLAGATYRARPQHTGYGVTHPDCPLCYAKYRVRAAPATRLIEEGDVPDLGNRVLQVLHTPGHSPGGISLWEAQTQRLFSGDMLYDGPQIEDAYHSNLEDNAQSLGGYANCPYAPCTAGISRVLGAAHARADRRTPIGSPEDIQRRR